MLYIIRNSKWDLMDFLWDDIDIPHEYVYHPATIDNKKNRLIHKIAHVLWYFGVFIKWRMFDDSIYSKLKTLGKDDSVLFVGYSARSVLNLYPYISPKVKVRLFFWDSLNNIFDFKIVMKFLTKTRIGISTYDKNDAKEYGLRYIPQQYNFMGARRYFSNVIPKYDLYYLGSAFDDVRVPIMEKVLKQIEPLGLNNNILIVDNKRVIWISYVENLKNTLLAKCILELNKPDQVGLTMRTMESLAMKKKLVTSNVNVKDYDFYNPNNIFILGEDDIDELKNFIDSPYQDVPDDVVMQYDVNTWIKRVLE